MLTLELALVSVSAIVFVTYRSHRTRQKRSRFDSLRPLSPNTVEIITRIENAHLQCSDQLGKVSLKELFDALRNFRDLAHEADIMRLEDERNAEEFEILHAVHSKNGRDMSVRLLLALLEKVVNAVTGSTSQLYAYATLSSYSREVDIVFEIMELGGDKRARRLAEHLP